MLGELGPVSPIKAGFDPCAALRIARVDTDLEWWVLHTRPRQEKALAVDLFKREIDVYLPLARLERRYGKRREVVEKPLFPGYLFLRGRPQDRVTALTTNRIVRTLRVLDPVRLEDDLRRIDLMISSGEAVTTFSGLKEGGRCRVVGGPLIGLEGVVIRRRNLSRIFVGVDILGQSGVVEIDSVLLEPID